MRSLILCTHSVLKITFDNWTISKQYCIFLVNFTFVRTLCLDNSETAGEQPYKDSALHKVICWWFVGNHQPQGWIPQSKFEVWTPAYLYLPAKKMQNEFIICLLALSLTCGMHETHLKPVLLHHKQSVHDVMTYFWLVYGNCGTRKIVLWQVNYHFNQTLWQIIIHTLFRALLT